MKTFDVQAIELAVPATRAFAYIADPATLPEWTRAFASVDGRRASMRAAEGGVTVDLDVRASAEQGTIDWRMGFSDGSVATAFSRLVDTGTGRCVFTFILTPPPVPLEEIEGALDAQSRILAEELQTLKGVLERRG